jgi:Cu/Ag efflux protein CusF
MKKNAGGILSQALLIVFVSVLAPGCGGSKEKPEGEPQRFQFRGLVMAVERARQHVTISHGDIPNLMKAMTMSFPVKDTSLLRGIEAGDSVSGVIAKRHPEVWLDSLVLIVAPKPGHQR